MGVLRAVVFVLSFLLVFTLVFDGFWGFGFFRFRIRI